MPSHLQIIPGEMLEPRKSEAIGSVMRILGVIPQGMSLRFTKSISPEQFGTLFDTVQGLQRIVKTSLNFWLGDIYNALDAQHGTKKEQVLDGWGEGVYNHLRNCGSLARAFEPTRRLERIPWDVYRELQVLPRSQQDTWIGAPTPPTRQQIRDHKAKLKEIQDSQQTMMTGQEEGQTPPTDDASVSPARQEDSAPVDQPYTDIPVVNVPDTITDEPSTRDTAAAPRKMEILPPEEPEPDDEELERTFILSEGAYDQLKAITLALNKKAKQRDRYKIDGVLEQCIRLQYQSLVDQSI